MCKPYVYVKGYYCNTERDLTELVEVDVINADKFYELLRDLEKQQYAYDHQEEAVIYELMVKFIKNIMRSYAI